jgi:hypothetical protein
VSDRVLKRDMLLKFSSAFTGIGKTPFDACLEHGFSTR